MRNLIQPITKEVGIITIRGRDYHMQTISYGSRNQVHVFRKGALHLRGMVFNTQLEYDQWKNGMHQLDLFKFHLERMEGHVRIRPDYAE
jgi:hypothetical protein